MPKIVDHDERRREIIHATWRVMRRIGVDATTVREIAREAGYSNGVLAHYFTSKEELLIMAHEQAFKEARERMDHVSTGTAAGLEQLRLVILEALPLDEVRDLEAFVDMSFLAQSMVNAELRAARTESHLTAQKDWGIYFARLRSEGFITTATPDDVLVDELIMLIDALSGQALLFPDIATPERQTTLVESYISRLTAR
jgi:AcrR family transcriptional regulator